MYLCAVHFDTFDLLCPVSYLEHACYFAFPCNRCNKEHFELELELDLWNGGHIVSASMCYHKRNLRNIIVSLLTLHLRWNRYYLSHNVYSEREQSRQLCSNSASGHRGLGNLCCMMVLFNIAMKDYQQIVFDNSSLLADTQQCTSVLNDRHSKSVTNIIEHNYTCASVVRSILDTRRLSWWRHQMETFSALLAICAGNSPVPGEFSAQRPVTRSFDVFFGLRLNKRLSKQSWGWWFETLSRPLWRHCNDFSP